MPSTTRCLALTTGVTAVGIGWLHHLGRTSGSTPDERARRLPGDDLVEQPQFVTDHAVTIRAPAAEVWPWLVQMGWGRAGWYTARWVDDLLFPANGSSADRIHPEWQRLAVGDRILDGPPDTGCFFVVSDLEPSRHLVLRSTTHLPPGARERFGAWIDWTWAFVLDEVAPGTTRLHFRSRARLGPWWLTAGYWALMVPADHVMSTQMLRGVRARVTTGRTGEDEPMGDQDEAAAAVDERLDVDVAEPVGPVGADVTRSTDAEEPAAPMDVDERLTEDLGEQEEPAGVDPTLGQDVDESSDPQPAGVDPELFA